jgi:hypothetical protein
MCHAISAIIPRGNIRQRGDRLLVTRTQPFLQLLDLADALSAQRTSSGSRAAVFYFPLGPVFDLSLCRALLFSTSGLCAFTTSYFTKLCASARGHGGRERAALRPRLALRNIATLQARHIAGRIRQRRSTPSPLSAAILCTKNSITRSRCGFAPGFSSRGSDSRLALRLLALVVLIRCPLL